MADRAVTPGDIPSHLQVGIAALVAVPTRYLCMAHGNTIFTFPPFHCSVTLPFPRPLFYLSSDVSTVRLPSILLPAGSNRLCALSCISTHPIALANPPSETPSYSPVLCTL